MFSWNNVSVPLDNLWNRLLSSLQGDCLFGRKYFQCKLIVRSVNLLTEYKRHFISWKEEESIKLHLIEIPTEMYQRYPKQKYVFFWFVWTDSLKRKVIHTREWPVSGFSMLVNIVSVTFWPLFPLRAPVYHPVDWLWPAVDWSNSLNSYLLKGLSPN